MYIAILGRQPALGVAELECLYGAAAVRWFGAQAATITSDTFAFERLGGSQKAGRVVLELRGTWLAVSRQIVRHYSAQWQGAPHKITLGMSAYGFSATAREVQKTGLILKTKLRASGTSLRLIPNAAPALNTATSHHNKLGRSPHHIELLVVRAQDGRVIVAESVGAQNISALAARDQARPRTDAFVGMLPPKLARMMINMAGPLVQPSPTTEHSVPAPPTARPLLRYRHRPARGAPPRLRCVRQRPEPQDGQLYQREPCLAAAPLYCGYSWYSAEYYSGRCHYLPVGRCPAAQRRRLRDVPWPTLLCPACSH